MNKEQFISEKPSILWIDQGVLEERIQPYYYKANVIKEINKVINFPEVKKLGDLCNLITDGTHQTPKYVTKGTGVRFVTSKNINEFEISFDTDNDISVEEHNELKKTIPRHLDILMTKVGSRIGVSKVFPDNAPECNIFVSLALLRLKKETICPYFVEAFLNSKFGSIQAYRLSKGITQLDFHLGDIKRVLVPIPSKEIQGYIGGKVRKAQKLREEAMCLKKEAEQLLNECLHLDELRSILNNTREKQNWVESNDINDRIDSYFFKPKYTKLEKFISHFDYKITGEIATVDYGYMPMEDYSTVDLGIPMVRITNIIGDLIIDGSEMKYIPSNDKIKEKHYLKKGDILLVQLGDTTGKIAYITTEFEGHLFPSFCLKLSVKDNINIPTGYLALLYESIIMQTQIDKTISYSSVRPNTTKPAIESLKVPLIDVEMQQQISDMVERYMGLIRESKNLILESKIDIESLIEGTFDLSKITVID